MFRRRKREVPGLNTTSTADISFMLLIFFLVTTNMDVDKGLIRQLPPDRKNDNQESFVSKGTTLDLTITSHSKLLIDGKPSSFEGLDKKIEVFVNRVGKKHLRNQTAQRLFGCSYTSLSADRKEQVKDACPQRIAEQYHAGGSPAQSLNGKGTQQ